MVWLMLESALTVTIRVVVYKTVSEIAQRSLKLSSDLKSTSNILADGIVDFSAKLKFVVDGLSSKKPGKQLEEIISMDIRFNGTLVNRTMFYACQSISSMMTPACVQTLNLLDSQFGKEVLNASHPKLYHISTVCAGKSKGEDVEGAKNRVHFVISQLLFGLQSKSIEETSQVTLEFLKGTEDTKGFVELMLIKSKFCDHLVQMITCLPPPGVSDKILALSQGDRYRVAVAQAAAASETTMQDESMVAQLMEGHTLGNNEAMVNLFLSVLHGVYNSDLQSHELECALQSILDDKEGDLGIEYDKALKAADSVPAGNKEAVPMRVLARMASDPTKDLEHRRTMAEVERQSVYEKAATVKKKLVTLVQYNSKSISPSGIKSIFEKSSAFSWHGSLNESHRLFIISADLEIEPAGAFSAPVMLSGDTLANFKKKLEFMKSIKGSADFLIAFDGRCRANRAAVESFLPAEPTEQAEMWISYTGSVNRAPSRQVFAGNMNREVGFIRLPCGRVRLQTCDREDCGFAPACRLQ